MPSFLVITEDPAVSEAVQNFSSSGKYRFKVCLTIDAAQNWLAMQKFEFVIADATHSKENILQLFSLAWSYHPLAAGFIVDIHDRFPDRWTAALLGIDLFSGPSAWTDLFRHLDAIIENQQLAEKPSFAVLVVEDLDSPRDIICAYVESLGYSKVVGASSAKEALAVLSADPEEYCAIVTDIQMPRVNGIELIHQIRQQENTCFLPIIVLTSAPTAEHLIQCIKAGASGFLVKPPKKKLLNKELEKAKRIVLTRRSPRLCKPEDAHLLEDALRYQGLI